MEVHPPEHPVHSWRDVFAHLGIVTLGLLIALGLEAVAEAYHHHREVIETREALRKERETNHEAVKEASIFFRREGAALQNNLLVLRYIQAHPHTRATELPGIVTWHGTTFSPAMVSWQTAQNQNVTAYMPLEEVRLTSSLYELLRTADEASRRCWFTLNTAREYSFSDPDPTHLSPAQVSEVIARTEGTLRELFIFGVAILNVGQNFTDFQEGLTRQEVVSLTHMPDVEQNPALAGPRALTVARIDAAARATDNFPEAEAPAPAGAR